jgi:hypothetical protein
MKEEIPQLYALCGRGARSTLRVLRPGLAATEIAVSPLPGNPTGIWTIKRSYKDAFDAYIIVAFTNATLVSAIDMALAWFMAMSCRRFKCRVHELWGRASLLLLYRCSLLARL